MELLHVKINLFTIGIIKGIFFNKNLILLQDGVTAFHSQIQGRLYIPEFKIDLLFILYVSLI